VAEQNASSERRRSDGGEAKSASAVAYARTSASSRSEAALEQAPLKGGATFPPHSHFIGEIIQQHGVHIFVRLCVLAA
jgi:hypothetical protein